MTPHFPEKSPEDPMHTDITTFQPNQNVSDVYLVRDCQLRTTKTGKYYLHLVLGDRTGAVNGRMWDATEALFAALNGARFVRVGGRVEVYREALQLIVHNIRAVKADEVDASEFLPTTKRDVDEMFAKLKKLATTVENPHLAQLVDAFLSDETFAAKFKKAPAAVSYHQPFLGGLLEHTLTVTELADIIATRYPQLDRDLLIAGCILHDIGKVDELAYESNFEYTDRCRLIGHLIIAVEAVRDRVRDIDGFPEHLFDLLSHLILSHHGEHEWGSPKLPMTAEAFALHHLDNLDAKVEASSRAIEADNLGGGNWTEFNRMFQRRLYRGPGAGEPDGDDADAS